MLVDVTLDLLRAAAPGDIGLQRERELLEIVHTGIVVFRFEAGIGHIRAGRGMALELGLSSLLVGLDGLIRGATAGIGACVVKFQIVRRIGVGGQVHGIDCHSKAEVCSQQSCGNHKQR